MHDKWLMRSIVSQFCTGLANILPTILLGIFLCDIYLGAAPPARTNPSAGSTFEVWCKRIQIYLGRIVVGSVEFLDIFTR